MLYTPDRWVVVKIEYKDELIHKVLAGWNGGYLGSDSWKLNSGITKIEMDEDYYLFHGYSGSVYKCHKNAYGFTSLTGSIFATWKEQHPDNFEIIKEGSLDVLRQTYS